MPIDWSSNGRPTGPFRLRIATSQKAVATIVANITQWVSQGTVNVPADTTAAAMRVAVPKHTLQTNTQP